MWGECDREKRIQKDSKGSVGATALPFTEVGNPGRGMRWGQGESRVWFRLYYYLLNYLKNQLEIKNFNLDIS